MKVDSLPPRKIMTLAALTERIKLSFFEYILELGMYVSSKYLSCESPVHIVVDHNWQFSPAMHFQCNFFKGIMTHRMKTFMKLQLKYIFCYTPRFAQVFASVSSNYGLRKSQNDFCCLKFSIFKTDAKI